MNIMWITNRPIGAAEKVLSTQPISGSWMKPTLIELNTRTNVHMTVVTLWNVSEIQGFSEEGIDYYLLPNPGAENYDYNNPVNISIWEKTIEIANPDLIMVWGTEYAYGLCAINVANKRKIPVIIELQGIMSSIERYYLGGMTRNEIKSAISFRDIIKFDNLYRKQNAYHKRAIIEKTMISAAQNIIIENEWARSFCLGIDNEIHVYKHNINVDKCFLSKQWAINECEKDILFCSSPGGYPLKGFHILLKALVIVKKEYPEIKLMVPGMNSPFDLSLREKLLESGYITFLRKMISENNLRESLIFLGRLTSAQMADNMVKSRLMIVPSAIENHSVTLREAMVMGMPCIASYVGGMPEVIDNRNDGLLYRFEDHEMLAHHIISLLSDRELSVSLGKRARTKMQVHLDIKATTDELIKIYENVIDNNA